MGMLDLPPDEYFGSQQGERMDRIDSDNHLLDEDVMNEDRMIADHRDNRGGVCEAAGFEDDGVERALPFSSHAPITKVHQAFEERVAFRAAGATAGNDCHVGNVRKQRIVDGSSRRLIDDDGGISERADMQLMSQPRGFAGTEKAGQDDKLRAMLGNRTHELPSAPGML